MAYAKAAKEQLVPLPLLFERRFFSNPFSGKVNHLRLHGCNGGFDFLEPGERFPIAKAEYLWAMLARKI